MAEAENSDQSPSIDDLPDEVLLLIFSHVSPHHLLLTTLSLVCPRWHTLHADPTLYRHLDFTYNQPATGVAVQMLQMAPRLESLRMSDRKDADDILQHVGGRDTLETLVIRACVGSPDMHSVSSLHLGAILEHCRGIRHLSLKETHCSDVRFYNTIGVRLSSLRSIDFGLSLDMSPDALLNVANNCRYVEELRIRSHAFHITEALSAFFAAFDATLRVVKTNCLFCNNAAMTSLAACSNLTTLYLDSGHRITDRGIMAVAGLPNLVKLRVKCAHHITPQGWLQLFQAPHMQGLRQLSLHGRSLNDEALSAISCLPLLTNLSVHEANHVTPPCWIALLSAPHLQHRLAKLYVADCWHLRDEAVLVIGHMHGLLELTLSLVYVTTACWTELLDMPNMRRLVKLCLANGNVDDAAIAAVGRMVHLADLTVQHADLFTPEGWVACFETPAMKGVESVWLHFCEGVDDTVAAAVARNLSRLRVCRLTRCIHLTDQCVQLLQQQISDRCRFSNS